LLCRPFAFSPSPIIPSSALPLPAMFALSRLLSIPTACFPSRVNRLAFDGLVDISEEEFQIEEWDGHSRVQISGNLENEESYSLFVADERQRELIECRHIPFQPSPLLTMPVIPLRAIVSQLDPMSYRNLAATSSTMNTRVKGLNMPEPEQNLTNFELRMHYKCRCPHNRASYCGIKAECDGQRIEWHFHKKYLIVPQKGYAQLKFYMSFKEVLKKATLNARWDMLTITGYMYHERGPIFTYRGYQVTIGKV
ncbi:hypothetical protein PMAYCL1PPCAC_10717, partial [Pristionchus mayeri]